MSVRDFGQSTKGKARSRVVKLKNAVESTAVITFFRSLIFLISFGFIVASFINLIYASYFPITNEQVHITGNDIIPSEVIYNLTNSENRPLNELDVYEMKIAVEKFIWVKEANFKINYPAGIEAQITERKPVAFFRVRDHIYMLDEEMKILPTMYNQKGWNLPVIEDMTVTGIIKPGEIVRYPSLFSAMQLIKIFDRRNIFTPEMIADIDISDMFNIKVSTYGKNFSIHFGYNDFENKIKNLYYAIPEIEKLKNARIIDLRYKNKVIVR